MHFEVYPSVAAATSGGTKLATSQIALPKDACAAVYATTGYEQSVRNLSQVSLASDMVFSDGVSLETPSMTSNTSSGYVSSSWSECRIGLTVTPSGKPLVRHRR